MVFYCIQYLAGISQNSYKIAQLTNIKNRYKSKLFQINWASKNYMVHLKTQLWAAFLLSGFTAIDYLYWLSKSRKPIVINTPEISGIIFGSCFAFAIYGILIASIQYIAQKTVIIIYII